MHTHIYIKLYMHMFYSFGFPIAVSTSASNGDKTHQLQDLAQQKLELGTGMWWCGDTLGAL